MVTGLAGVTARRLKFALPSWARWKECAAMPVNHALFTTSPDGSSQPLHQPLPSLCELAERIDHPLGYSPTWPRNSPR